MLQKVSHRRQRTGGDRASPSILRGVQPPTLRDSAELKDLLPSNSSGYSPFGIATERTRRTTTKKHTATTAASIPEATNTGQSDDIAPANDWADACRGSFGGDGGSVFQIQIRFGGDRTSPSGQNAPLRGEQMKTQAACTGQSVSVPSHGTWDPHPRGIPQYCLKDPLWIVPKWNLNIQRKQRFIGWTSNDPDSEKPTGTSGPRQRGIARPNHRPRTVIQNAITFRQNKPSKT